MSPRRPASPAAPANPAEVDVVLHQETLAVDKVAEPTGTVRARKRVETEPVEQTVQRGVEAADIEREGVDDPADTGETITLADGSVSIPIFEEQIIVTKRLVVRERIVIRKHTVYEEHLVTADLRHEELDITTDS